MIVLLLLMMVLLVSTMGVQVRRPAPEWSGTALVSNDQFKVIGSKDYLGKWLVLFFYPLDFTFVCPTEIVSYSEAAERELQQIGAHVVGVSVDSKFTHLAFASAPRSEGGLGGIGIPLVADITKEISRAYGVLDDIPVRIFCTCVGR